MKCFWLIVAALAAFAVPATGPAQEGTRPLDRIYGPRQPGTAQPARPATPLSPAARRMTPSPSYDPGTRPLDRIYGPGGGTATRGGGVGGGTTVGRPQGSTGLGAGSSRSTLGTTRKPTGPTYRGGHVGTRHRFSNSPSLSRPRR